MSTEMLSQIDKIEKACHAALANGDDASTIDVLVRTLTTVRFTVSDSDKPVVRGLANQATAHADMILHALRTDGAEPFVHAGLTKLCTTLEDLRNTLHADPHCPCDS